MAHPKHKRLLLACSPLILVVGAFAYAIQTAQLEIKGVTIQSRIYQETTDGKLREMGTKTTYVSQSGNWKTIKRNTKNEITQVLLADSNRGGVFVVSKDTAVKVGEFRKNTLANKPEEYRTSSQYAGETSYLGYRAFINHSKGDKGELIAESIYIPEFKLPVKVIAYDEDGSKTITEAISITLGEPSNENVKLPPHVVVTGEVTDPNLKPKKLARGTS